MRAITIVQKSVGVSSNYNIHTRNVMSDAEIFGEPSVTQAHDLVDPL